MENEICPILVVLADACPNINKDEVESVKWVSWEEFLRETRKNPKKYSPWCVEQAKILNKNEKFKEFISQVP
jgi:isopentenyl-diphosphate delta-isomerase